MNATLEDSGATTDKYYNMKQFVVLVRHYVQTKADESANLLNRYLQLISVTIDLSTFDPHTNVVPEFFVSLHELMSVIEPGSLLAWCCVNVLGAACKNSAARTALIHTYQFLPLLSRMLGNQLSTEKKLRLLTLMQELTCGIKISWQIPHLPHLMFTLTRWIANAEEEIVILSLAVLVNLCYKNLPAVYTLSRCVDIKKFVHTCLPLKGLKIEVHLCKLLIILDYMNGKVQQEAFLKLLDVTFKSLVEAFKADDCILLRHVVEFFLDMWNQSNQREILQNFGNYDNEIDNLILELENTDESEDENYYINNRAECMALTFEFLHFIIKLRKPNVTDLNSRLVKLALQWIQVEAVCSNSLIVLRTVAENTTEETCTVLNPFLASLPVLLLGVGSGDDEIATNVESNKRLRSLMELLRALMKAESTRNRILAVLKEELFLKILKPLITCPTSANEESHVVACSLEANDLYVSSIILVYELQKHEERWKQHFAYLMGYKQIQMIVAEALFKGSKETKALILKMSAGADFPVDEISSVMCDLQTILQTETNVSNKHSNAGDNLCFPMMSITQIERLDEVLTILKDAYEKNNLLNVSTSDVMELYEYKVATMSHAERAALASVEAASLRCTQLQHRTAQLSAELCRLHQLLLYTQQCHEEAVKSKNESASKQKLLQEKFDKETANFTNQLMRKEKVISDTTMQLDDANKQLREKDKENNVLEEQNIEFKRAITKLEKNLTKKEKLLEKTETMLSKSNSETESLKIMVSQLEKQIKITENELVARTRELTEVSKELHNCKSILGTITQLTKSQYIKNG